MFDKDQVKLEQKKGFQKGRIPWNKGLTKENNEKISEMSKKTSETLMLKEKRPTGKASNPEKEKERKRKISETMKKNPNSGGLREGSGRGKKCWYNSPIAGNVYLRSTYELEYVKYLDLNNIIWTANKKSFKYQFEGKEYKYYPDFYLVELDLFIEIKGFKTLKDEEKWKVIPNLKVLFYKDLIELGIDVKR